MSLLKICSVCAIMLLFFLIGCGPASVSPTVMPTPQLADNPTAGAVARSTRQTRATLDAQATATEQTQLDETATPIAATQTAEAQANATATISARATVQAIVTEQAVWPLSVTDVFTDNHLGWPIGVKQDHSLAVTSTIANDGYHWIVTVFDGNSYFNLVPTHSPVFTDFAATVNVQFGSQDAGTSAYGIAFRQVKDDYGFFGIKASGEWLALEVHHTGIYQSDGGYSRLINLQPGHPNRLDVIARGSDFVLFINGQQVGMLTAEIDSGQIGLGVDAGRRAATTDVEFTNFEVHAP